MKVEQIANTINRECDNRRYFWASGIVRETLNLWNDRAVNLLCPEAKQMVEHYQKEGIERPERVTESNQESTNRETIERIKNECQEGNQGPLFELLLTLLNRTDNLLALLKFQHKNTAKALDDNDFLREIITKKWNRESVLKDATR